MQCVSRTTQSGPQNSHLSVTEVAAPNSANWQPSVAADEVADVFSFARHNRVEDIEQLLDRGMTADDRDEFGNTILIIACQVRATNSIAPERSEERRGGKEWDSTVRTGGASSH